MKYTLNKTEQENKKIGGFKALDRLWPLVKKEKRDLLIAMVAVLFNSGAALAAPFIISYTVDHYMSARDFNGVLAAAGLLLAVYAVGLVSAYIQTMRMGSVGRRVLYNFRNEIFLKLQELPVAFFNQNKAGDLISRINNDTDRLNQFFAQALMQFVGSFFIIVGAGVLLLVLNVRLGVASLLPALFVLIVTRLISPWVRRRNKESLQSLGGMSAEIQESLGNFKVIVAFNRLDYFRDKFSLANGLNFKASVNAAFANAVFMPIYVLASNLAQLTVLAYGVWLIAHGDMTVGLLIGYLLYVNNFYFPLRQLASVWSSFEQSLAALDRVSEVLSLKTDMEVLPWSGKDVAAENAPILTFRDVTFRYPDGEDVLHRINLELHRGKTYALVGPTGGGKTTTASIMARLYDPTEGKVELGGRDIRTYDPEERARKIGFILQEPFLFSGSLLDNLFYGHPEFAGSNQKQREAALAELGMDELLQNFEKGLDTQIKTGGESISLGQRQLIAFVRAVLRHPEILILDEATANIDTVTEQMLDKALDKLSAKTTKVIIAHRLNTIENADEIYFVNHGEVVPAGSFQHAVEMLMHGRRTS